MFLIIRLAVIGLLLFLLFKGILFVIHELFSDTKRCPRCEGKGWWQNTRNREKCEWCKGEGRIPKDFPLS
jgi:hypothetical protein